MDLKKHYLEIQNFLTQYYPLWSSEVIHTYPYFKQNYPQEYLDSLAKLDVDQLWKIDSGRQYQLLGNQKLQQIFEQIQKLEKIPNAPFEPFLPARATWNNIKVKKQHEISRLVGFLKQTPGKFRKCIDIGGGLGHTARVLADTFQVDSFCLEKDPELCLKGEKINSNVHFHSCQVGVDDSSHFSAIADEHTMILGLHTCGPLSNLLLNRYVNSNSFGLLNFGCCYLKLDPINDTHLSELAKEYPLRFTVHALTLASRANNQRSQAEFDFTYKVKNFRYTLHLLLHHKLDRPDFLGVGNSKYEIYQKDFAGYALERLEKAGIHHHLTKKELNNFHAKKWVKDATRDMFLCNVIRWRFGRLIELALLLDRALFLQEQGKRPQLFQFFEEAVSPRNIGIYAAR